MTHGDGDGETDLVVECLLIRWMFFSFNFLISNGILEVLSEILFIAVHPRA